MDRMKKFEIAKQLIQQWIEEDKENGEFHLYGTNVKLTSLFVEEVEKELERAVVNSMLGKGTKIDGKKILEKVKTKAKG